MVLSPGLPVLGGMGWGGVGGSSMLVSRKDRKERGGPALSLGPGCCLCLLHHLGILWHREHGATPPVPHVRPPKPCWDSTAPLPRPYLPTAKTVSPMVRFCCIASCWATSGSKVPSQIMGAPQEVQVRTSGRALARAGMRDRSIRPPIWRCSLPSSHAGP